MSNRQKIEPIMALFRQQRFTEAEKLARELTAKSPNDGLAWKALGASLKAQGRSKNALTAMERAAGLLSDDAEVRYHQAQIHAEMGQLSKAEACYRQALQIQPDAALLHNELGNTLYDLKRLDEAAASYRKVLDLSPNYAMAYNNLGHILSEQKCLADAEVCYRCALELSPGNAEVLCNLGVTLHELNRQAEAEACYRQALAQRPDYAQAHYNLGIALKAQKRLQEAELSYRKALAIDPGHGAVLVNLGTTHYELDQFDAAESCYRRALDINPKDEQAHYNLGVILHNTGRSEAAEASYRQALRLKPDYADALYDLGVVLDTLRRPEEAVASYRHALRIAPSSANANSNLLFALAYNDLVSPPAYLSEAKAWEMRVIPDQQRLTAAQRNFDLPPRSGRRLRVGYVSGDLNAHAVSFFIEPILRQHNRMNFEITAYPTSKKHDSTSDRLLPLFDHWHPIVDLSDDEALSKIESDKIDILVDLSGHTARNRMGVFARRAAPVQIHYLGFYASTGLSTMDYWISDSILLPPTEDQKFCEKIWRLPRVWVCYQGNDAPVTEWAAADGRLCLGSFNNLNKITSTSLRLWAKILRALPNAMLLLKTKELAQDANRQRIESELASLGIPAHRIELLGGMQDWQTHMAFYDRLDIALDPVGAIGGGTTTCDALWMGAPIITLPGPTKGQRMTASMLHAIGHPEWIAADEDEYIEKIVTLANDVELRRTLRFSQREQMRNSPLCDAIGLTTALEDAYAAMFDIWWETHAR
jgi:predicted O-linked N-acetylglucosamine transferase (SPINDLY family)